LADRGVHPPDQMPFRMPWTDRSGQELVDSTAEYHLRMREEWRPEKWTLVLCVFLDHRPVGAQDVRGDEFASNRQFETGSWLRREYQGEGYRTVVRAGVLPHG